MDFVHIVLVLNSSLWIIVLPNCCHCAPTFNSRILDVDNYLVTFGYMKNQHSEEKENVDNISEIRRKALRRFQKFNSLPLTGVVDHGTYVMMRKPRCGVIDNPDDDDDVANENEVPKPLAYVLSGPKWNKKVISWKISIFTSQLTHKEQKKTFKAALEKWQEVSQLRFEYTERIPDIDILFVKGDHNDGSPFDGRSRKDQGSILAHAFPPGLAPLSGDAHFDDDELWTTDRETATGNRKFLELVAAHEFGHSLGLQHSKKTGALMNAYYKSTGEDYLSYDDVYGIQALYGAPEGWYPTIGAWAPTTAPPFPTCNNLFQAVVRGPDNRKWGIYNNKVYLIGGDTTNRTMELQDLFPGAPVGVDFAFTMPSGKQTYMFMGLSVWRFDGYRLENGYPHFFPEHSMPEEPLAIFGTTEGGVEEIFIFGEKHFWRFRDNNYASSKAPAKQCIKNFWSYNPAKYSLVTMWFGDIYLINKHSHVRLRNRNPRVGYPKKGVPDWILQSCPNSAGACFFSTLHITITVCIVTFTSLTKPS